MPRDNGFRGFSDIHPDLRAIARFLPRAFPSPGSLRLFRAAERLPQWRVAKGVEVLTLRSGRGVRLHRPPATQGAAPALLWIHGGGLVLGKPAHTDDLCHRLSRTLGITVAAPEYRHAPEHTYPAALDDCYEALQWLASLPAVDASRVSIGGESAGGGLAAALAFMIRDRGEICPVLQLLSYPMLDDRTVSKPAAAHNYRLWNARMNQSAWAWYLGQADPDVAVPARRIDLAGLPPAWIGVGTADLFYHEDVAYCERLRSAGVPCQLEVVDGAFHGFDRVAQRTSVARAFFENQCEALRQALG
ncbi:MAG: alpha/beta hydrolase [Mycobacterium sp.]